MGIKHKFVSQKADDADATLVRPSNWNDDHSIDGGTSFPGSPAEKDLYYRTDLHKWYIYSGTAWVDLTASAGAGADEKVKVSSNDTVADYLLNKLAAGSGISITEVNDGAEEDVALATNPLGARVYHNANQSIPNSSWTTLSFNSERFDTDTIHDTVTNNARLTCKTAGKHIITVNLLFDVSATGLRAARFLVNGATSIAEQYQAPSPASYTAVTVATIYDLAVNDFVIVQAFHQHGSALNILSIGNLSPEFAMMRIA